MTETILVETNREALINRPHNDAGSINRVQKERYSITPTEVKLTESNTVPALLKLFMESLDNPIDVAIKGGCDTITIKVDSKSIHIIDNGYGIKSDKNPQTGNYNLFTAFCEYNSSANYAKDVKGQGQKGVNGKGIKLCTTLSTHFTVKTDDGKGVVLIKGTENNLNHKITTSPSTGKTGIDFKFFPDFNIFEVQEIDQEHIDRMFEYTLIQALTYPDITFKFNGKLVRYTPKKFLSLFGESPIVESHDDYFFAVLSNPLDDFRQISFVNGLETSKGGSHIDFISSTLVQGIRTKLLKNKKYKTIKPGDIKNKLQIVLIAKNMKNINWDGQTKESISSTPAQMRDYFNEVNFDKLIQKILKSSEIMDNITEIFNLKEQAKLNIDLKNADKFKKKPKSDKFMPPIGLWDNIFLAEGDSASNSISKILGRQGNGFYAMFGVPPNAYSMAMKDILASKKLIDLKDIVGLQYSQTTQDNLNFKNIIITTDFDLPGHFITGQLIGLLYRFGKNLFEENRIKRLVTPLLVAKDSKEKIVKWFYTFEDYQVFQRQNKTKNYVYDYKKGLGSWDQEELDIVINKDGLENMLEIFQLDENAELNIENWLGDDTDKRKEMLDGFEFNVLAS